MLLTGILLSSALVLIAVESVGYSRGGYNGAFWKLPLDDKLDHVAKHDHDWWWVGSWSLVGIFLMTGGLTALAYLLADAGEPVLAFVGLGIFLVAMIAWVFGLIFQTAGVSQAAKQRQESGETPLWIHPLWSAGYLSESAWVVGANIAYAVIGLAILNTGLLPGWAGWTAIALGVLIPVGVAITKTGFPQLADLAPLVIGVAAILEAV